MILRMTKLAILPLLGWLLACGCGQKVDASKFTSARLLDDGNTVAYCAQHLVYRRASGMAAYPDGGSSSYLTDRVVIGLYDLREKRITVSDRRENDSWEHGQGAAILIDARGLWLLVRRAGQQRDTLLGKTEHLLLHGADLTESPLDLDDHLQAAGLAFSEARFTDDRGTLAVVATAPDGSTQIHARLANGTWRAALTGQYNGTQNGEIFCWQGGQQLLAYNPVTDARRTIPANAVAPLPDATVGVNPANDHLEYGVRTDSGWQYSPLPLTLADALD